MSDESIERKINNSLLRVQERHLERIKQLEQENAKLKEKVIARNTELRYAYPTIQKLEQENAKLKERLKDAESVIDFYAKPSVWGVASPSDMTSIDPCDVGDFFHQEIGVTSRGGKRAREYFKKWGE